MPYSVRLVKSASKAVVSLEKKLQQQVLAAIRELAETPRHIGVKKLEGNSERYRARVRDYRIIFSIDDAASAITIEEVVDRKDAYK